MGGTPSRSSEPSNPTRATIGQRVWVGPAGLPAWFPLARVIYAAVMDRALHRGERSVGHSPTVAPSG